MDLSKLPRLSQTKQGDVPTPVADPVDAATPPPAAQERPPVPVYQVAPASADPASAWVSIAIGIILLLIYPTMLKYISSVLFGTAFLPFTMPDGTVVPYHQVHPQFLSDLSITLFAFVLIMDAIVLAVARSTWIVAVAFGLTVLVTLLNLVYIGITMPQYGPPLVSLLAVAFGLYIALQQHRLLQLLRLNAR